MPTVVLYRVSNIGDAVLLRELQELCRQRGAWLHVLAGRTGQGNPPFAPFEPDQLAALVPDIAHRDVYVCGPRGDDGVGAAQPPGAEGAPRADPRRALQPRLGGC